MYDTPANGARFVCARYGAAPVGVGPVEREWMMVVYCLITQTLKVTIVSYEVIRQPSGLCCWSSCKTVSKFVRVDMAICSTYAEHDHGRLSSAFGRHVELLSIYFRK